MGISLAETQASKDAWIKWLYREAAEQMAMVWVCEYCHVQRDEPPQCRGCGASAPDRIVRAWEKRAG